MSADEIIISKTLPYAVRFLRPERNELLKHVEPLQVEKEVPELTLWNKVRLIPYISQFIYGVIMKNWKTTISGVVGGIAYLTNAIFGVIIPSEAIIAVSLFLVGLFSQDASND